LELSQRSAPEEPPVLPAPQDGSPPAARLRLLKFLVVGGASTVVTVGLFNLLVHAGSQPIMSEQPLVGFVLALLLGLVVNYVGNRYWVFDAPRARTRTSEISFFLITNALALLIPSLCLAVSRYGLGLTSALADNVAANGVGLVLATCSRWLAYRFVVFAAPLHSGKSRDSSKNRVRTP
jgi:putative flippase GtrA